mmetsp:Transcript_20160/g.51039  ORF Transcript_20160/g.51039 Transcript_20160/m.51039 type:complete len:100 (-) Transcript_20160:191-490(-)
MARGCSSTVGAPSPPPPPPSARAPPRPSLAPLAPPVLGVLASGVRGRPWPFATERCQIEAFPVCPHDVMLHSFFPERGMALVCKLTEQERREATLPAIK